MQVPFVPFPKIPRWKSEWCCITEKIDGTNASVFINEDCTKIVAGSRNRWLSLDFDNYGFAKFVDDNRTALLQLGKGHHFGEWWGEGIGRNYGLREKRFSLFNVRRWKSDEQKARLAASPCGVVPVLYEGPFSDAIVEETAGLLYREGSKAAPGYGNPEGIILYLPQGDRLFKWTFDGNKTKWQEQSKG